MLIRQATVAQTAPHLRIAYDQLYADLTPAQQAQVNFDTVQSDVHAVVRQQRDLNLKLDPMTPAQAVAAMIKKLADEASHIAADAAAQANNTASEIDCGVAIATVVIDAVMVVIQAIGLPGAIAQRTSGRLVTEATPLIARSLRTYRILVNNVRAAVTGMEKAKAYYQIFVTFTRSFGIKAIFKEIRHSMHWYDWLLMGLIILGQVLLLIATDGAAIFLEISLLILSITALGASIYNAVQACKLDTNRGRSAPEIADKGLILLPGEILTINEQLESANGAYRAIIQPDGNFVLYNKANQVLWQTATSGIPGSALALSDTGFLTLETAPNSNVIIWSPNIGGAKGNYLMLSNNGQLMIMNSIDQTTKWTSN